MLLENLCALHLKRNYNDVFFYSKGVEVDFFVPVKGYAVQACWSLEDEDTRNREVNALMKLDMFVNLEKMEIITADEEEVMTLPNGKHIDVIPAWKWLLARNP